MSKGQWESDCGDLVRIKVEGGYIYRTYAVDNPALCFVPDVDLQRYQSHLRDAYKQGYKAGHQDARNGEQLKEESS